MQSLLILGGGGGGEDPGEQGAEGGCGRWEKRGQEVGFLIVQGKKMRKNEKNRNISYYFVINSINRKGPLRKV